MIKCSKCNELIGADLEVCPFCKHEITKEEKINAAIEEGKLHSEAVYGATRLNLERILMSVGFTVVMCIMIGLVTIFTSQYDFYPVIVGAVVLVFIGLYIWAVKKFKMECCPYCDSYIFSGLLFKKHCPRCGAKIM